MYDPTLYVETQIENRYYASVGLGQTLTQDYQVPSGAILTLANLGGNAPAGNNIALAQIIWDPLGSPQIVFATYNAGFQFSQMAFTGDGIKVMRISLTNTLAIGSAFIVGAYYSGTLDTPR